MTLPMQQYFFKQKWKKRFVKSDFVRHWHLAYISTGINTGNVVDLVDLVGLVGLDWSRLQPDPDPNPTRPRTRLDKKLLRICFVSLRNGNFNFLFEFYFQFFWGSRPTTFKTWVHLVWGHRGTTWKTCLLFVFNNFSFF